MSRRSSRFSTVYVGGLAALLAAVSVLGLVLTEETSGGAAGVLQTWGTGAAAVLLLVAAAGAGARTGPSRWPVAAAGVALLLLLAGVLAGPKGSSAFLPGSVALVIGGIFLVQVLPARTAPPSS